LQKRDPHPIKLQEFRVPGDLFIEMRGKGGLVREGRVFRVWWIDGLNRLQTGVISKAEVRVEGRGRGEWHKEEIGGSDIHFSPRDALKAQVKRLEQDVRELRSRLLEEGEDDDEG
jgi:hypothetical protein